jgi:hypothetical protein
LGFRIAVVDDVEDFALQINIHPARLLNFLVWSARPQKEFEGLLFLI